MSDLIPANVRLAARTLRREPVFLSTAVLSLAVAIALNTTMVSMYDAMLNPRVAGAHPERIYSFRYYGDVRHVLPRDAVAAALATGQRTYDAVTGFRGPLTTAGIARGDRARDVDPLIVRPDFFDVLGVQAQEGRFVAAAAGEAQSIVISDRLAGALFSDGRSPVSSTVSVDGRPSTIVAVTRRYPGFKVLDADVWIIASPANNEIVPVNLIRARAGQTRADVDRELVTLSARLAAAAGESPRDSRFYLRPVTLQFTVWGIHYALIGGVVAVLFVACANLGNLQFARGLNRAREIAVRSAVGASRRDIVSLLLTEVAVLAAAGLVLGLTLTYWGIGLLRAMIPDNAGGFVVAPDASWRMAAVAVGAAGLCVLLVGLAPAIRASRADLNSLIKTGAGTGAHRENRRRYGWLLIVQIGLTLPVVSAAVMLDQAAWVVTRPLYDATRFYGFEPNSLVVAHVNLPARRNAWVRVSGFADQLLSDAKSVSGVSVAAVTLNASPDHNAVSVSDSAGQASEFEAPLWSYQLVTPAYFRTMGFPVERGRDLVDGVYDASVAIVDRATSTYFWPNGYRSGAMIKFGDARSTAPWMRVEGVRGDHFDAETRPYIAWLDTLRVNQIYRVLTTTDSVRAGPKGVSMTLVARASRNPRAAAIALRQALRNRSLVTPPSVRWMADEIGITAARERRRFLTSIFTGAALVCLALAALGVYGIASQSIAQRRREIAVRISLGARPGDVIGLILREGNVFALAGVATGLLVTAGTISWLGQYLGRTSEFGMVFAFAGVSGVLFLVAAGAALIPAARAARIDPVEALRAE